jgi:predicted DsbA family dithiol-disulfide isomerase
MAEKPLVKIQIVSDIACPWCYVGKRRLETAMDKLGDKANFEVSWSAYQLNPAMPKEGYARDEYLKQKFGYSPRFQAMQNYLQESGQQCGIDFCFVAPGQKPTNNVSSNGNGHVPMVSNTFDGHRLMYFTKIRYPHLSDKMMDNLFKVYQEKGLNIAKKEVLLQVAEETGLNKDEVEKYLDSDEGKKEVQLEDDMAKDDRISGVPYFTIVGATPKLDEAALKTLSVKQLRTKLYLRGVNDSECVEKGDLIKKVLETNSLEKPKKKELSGAQDPNVFIQAIEEVILP